jgi:YhcH/YjgK/YiaL family protein
MIIDRLENASRYFPLNPRFQAAFRFLAEADLAGLPVGSTELAGPALRVDMLQAPAKSRASVKLEVHRQFIDIQFLISGQEQFGWKLTAECTQAEAPYDPGKDRLFYLDEPEAWFPLLPGMFAIFFPEDAHAPMLGEGELRKAVVKVAV